MVFHIDVGNMPPKEAWDLVLSIKNTNNNQFKSKKLLEILSIASSFGAF